jgi:hypothetical protein
MKNYLSIYKSVNRSRSHGTICDTLSLGDKFCFEKIHHKLGIRKSACNLIKVSNNLHDRSAGTFNKILNIFFFRTEYF